MAAAGEPLLSEESINHVVEIVAKHGTDAWWSLGIAELLPDSLKAGELRTALLATLEKHP